MSTQSRHTLITKYQSHSGHANVSPVPDCNLYIAPVEPVRGQKCAGRHWAEPRRGKDVGHSKLEGCMKPWVRVGLRHGVPIIAVLALFVVFPVHSADWPARPIHIVAPFGPAGAADKFARVLADYLPAELKQSVVVENRGGGGGIVGSAQVARAEPDGYTLLISSLASQAIAPALSPNPGFDSLRDFTHIAYFGGPPIGWVVTRDSDLQNVEGVMAKARQGTL